MSHVCKSIKVFFFNQIVKISSEEEKQTRDSHLEAMKMKKIQSYITILTLPEERIKT